MFIENVVTFKKNVGMLIENAWKTSDAANNIAALGASFVSSPESPGMSCQLEGQLSLFPIAQI